MTFRISIKSSDEVMTRNDFSNTDYTIMIIIITVIKQNVTLIICFNQTFFHNHVSMLSSFPISIFF